MLFFNACICSNISYKTGIEEIHFGSGGGFTGAVKTYKITADAKLYENEKEIKKIDKKKTLELFKKANEFKDFYFNEPENIYSFIEIKTKEKTNRIVWAGGSIKVNQKIIVYYNNLL
jgi:hypothetical protein